MVAVDVTRIHQVYSRKLEITRTEGRRIVWNEIFTRDSRFFDRGKREEKICGGSCFGGEKGRKSNFLIKKRIKINL